MFVQYFAIWSALTVNKGTAVIHYTNMPKGPWVQKLMTEWSANIQWRHVASPPTHIGNRPILKPAHAVDWYRLNVLQEEGGIYLDLDTVTVRPWTHLLNEKFVIGYETAHGQLYGLCNAVFMTEPKGVFITHWKRAYEPIFQPTGWGEASIHLPLQLYNQYYQANNQCTVLCPETFTKPDWAECEKIWIDSTEQIPSKLLVLHCWHENTVTKEHMHRIVQGYEWILQNQHTLYSKIVMEVYKTYTGV